MDKEAIALYVAAGNPAVLWHAEDEAVRLHYRLATRENPSVATSSSRKRKPQPQPDTIPRRIASPVEVLYQHAPRQR